MSPALPSYPAHLFPQVRRTLRTTRAPVVNNKENAVNTRLRSTTRAKPTSTVPSTSQPKPSGIARATASTVATRAKTAAAPTSRLDPAAQGKRKREALGEVARPSANIVRDAPGDGTTGLKGKAKAKDTFEGVVLKKPPSTAKPPSTTSRQTSKVVSSSTTSVTRSSTRLTRSSVQHVQQTKRQTVLQEVPEEEEDVPEPDYQEADAMAIDVPAPVPAPRRLTVARSSAAVEQSRVQIKQRARQAQAAPVELDDEEDLRAYKKRRTSDDVPDADFLAEQQVEQEVHLEAEEADPNGQGWIDLDAEDADDPLMVSEYVVDIFNYLKEVEVCGVRVIHFHLIADGVSDSKRRCRTPITWRCKKTSRGTCGAS